MSELAKIAEFGIAFLLLAGSLFSLLAAFGLLRLPDVYTRAHAATKSSTLGVICILIGAVLYFWLKDGHFSMKIVLGIVFLFATAPVAGQMIMRAAYRTGVPLWEGSAQDELKERLVREGEREQAAAQEADRE